MPKALVAAPEPEPLGGAVRRERLPGERDALRIVGWTVPSDDESRREPAGREAETPRASPAARSGGRAREQRRVFEQIAARFRPDLYRYAFWLSRDASVADDLVQEALLRGWKSLRKLKDERAAKQWLLTIVRREHARLYERKRLETVDIDALTGVPDALVTQPDDPDVTRLRRAILDLEPEYREPLVLQVLLGHGTREIGQLLGIRQGAVLTRLFRARKKLEAALAVDER